MPKLTQPTLASYKPPATGKRSIKDSSTPGLYMVLGASGARSWMMRLRMPVGGPPS